MGWMTGTVAKLIGGAFAVVALGVAIWLGVRFEMGLIDSRATCRSDLAQLQAKEQNAADSARAQQLSADRRAVQAMAAYARERASAAASARAAASAATARIASYRAALAHAESASSSARAQAALCLDPAIRQSQGFAKQCPTKP